MLLPPRDYQAESHEATRYYYDKGVWRQAHLWATGLGKTTGYALHIPQIFPDLVDRYGDDGGLCFIVHRREILYQAYEKFVEAYPDRWIGIEMGEEHAVGDEDFIFVSVDSLGRLLSNRIFKYMHRYFGAVIIDEGHHLTVDGTWDNVLNALGVGSDKSQHARMKNGMAPISLLLTATPDRHDGQSLKPFADEVVSKYDYKYGVDNGWLCDILAYEVRARRAESGLEVLLRAARDYGQGHRTLVFAESVMQSARFAKSLEEMGILSAAHIDGETDKDYRREKVNDFRNGKLDLLTNYAVFTEGTDVPGITMIMDAAPTKSRALHAQKIGRGSRPSEDAQVDLYKTAAERKAAIARSSKKHLTFMAIGYSPTEHGLTLVSVLTGRDTNINEDGKMVFSEVCDIIESTEEKLPELPLGAIETLDDIEVTLREVNVWTKTIYNEKLQALSPLMWVAKADSISLWLEENPFSDIDEDQTPVIVRFEKAGEEDGRQLWAKKWIRVGGWNKLLQKPIFRKEFLMGYTSDLQAAVNKFEKWLEKERPADYVSSLRGGHGPATEWQIRYLKRAGVKFNPENITEGTANLLIADHRIRQNDNYLQNRKKRKKYGNR